MILNIKVDTKSCLSPVDLKVLRRALDQNAAMPNPSIYEFARDWFFGAAKVISVTKGSSVHNSSESQEWYTPKAVVDSVIAALGEIDIDPCSNSHKNPNVPATMHYTKEDDGLSKEWHGRLYMNPPYGRDVKKWVDKALSEIAAGRVTEAVILVAARTDTRAFEALADTCRCWCAVKGRLKFSGCENSAPFPSAVFYYGPNLDNFHEAFQSYGAFWGAF